VLPFRNEEIATSSQCSQIISKSGKLPAATLRYIFAVPPAHTHTHICIHVHTVNQHTRASARHVSRINGGLSTRSGMKLREESRNSDRTLVNIIFVLFAARSRAIMDSARSARCYMPRSTTVTSEITAE